MEKGAFPTRRQEGLIGDNRDNVLQATREGSRNRRRPVVFAAIARALDAISF